MAPFRTLLFLAAGLSVADVTAVDALAATTNDGAIRIDIAPLAAEVRAGAPVMMVVTQRNVSNRPQVLALPVGEDQADLNFDVTVERRDGSAVRSTPAGLALSPDSDQPIAISRHAVTLAPGEASTTTFDAARLANFDRPGAYVIRLAPRGAHSLQSASAVITVR